MLEIKPFSFSYLKFVKIYLKIAEMKLALGFKECAKELRVHFGREFLKASFLHLHLLYMQSHAEISLNVLEGTVIKKEFNEALQ